VDGIRVDRGSAPWQTTPWAQVTHRSYARGQWPLWNPFQGAGEPLAANVQSAVFDPLLLAVHLHPTTLVWDRTYLFVFALAALASPLLAMFLQYLTVSFNAHGTLVGERTGATAALLYWVAPFANGYPTMPRLAGLQYDRGWSGAAVVALGGVAVATPRAMRRF